MNSPTQALASAITEKFILAAPQAAASALETLATHEVLQLIAPLKAQTLVACLNPMAPAKAAAVLRRLPIRQASYILTHLEVVQAARLMDAFSAPYRERISSVLEPAFLQLLKNAHSFGPQSVGHYMQTDCIVMRTDAKLAQVIERLKNLPRKKLPVWCVVTDKDNHFKGGVRTAEIALQSPQSLVGSVMSPMICVQPQLSCQEAASLLAAQEEEVAAVVDGKNVFLGLANSHSFPSATGKKSLWAKLTK